MQILITSKKRRCWGLLRPRRFSLQMPRSWGEVTPLARRQRWWRWVITLPRPAATRAMVRDLLPKWARRQISDLDFAGLTLLLDWIQPTETTDEVPVPTFTVDGIEYHFPAPKGRNVKCLEFAIGDQYYQRFVAGEAEALMLLVATVWREQERDGAMALRRNDSRAPLYSSGEVEARAILLQHAPEEMVLQALLYFGGLKAYIHKVYGKWLFEQPDDDDDEEEDDADTAKKPDQKTGSPDFGWWGVFQSVAEGGVFGNLDQVYQTSLHDVCIYLVRKRAESNNAPEPKQSPTQTDDDDDL